MAKKKIITSGIVYSTDPDFRSAEEQPEKETIAPGEQNLRLWFETKHRGGKAVSIVAGFIGSDSDLNNLGKQLKQACGTGGSVKDGEILIQGDHRDKILAWLQKKGYTKTKKAGG